MKMEWSVGEQGVNVVAPELHFGVRGLGLRVNVDGDDAVARYRPSDAVGDCIEAEGALTATLSVRTVVERDSASGALVLRHTLQNRGKAPCWVRLAATGTFAEGSAVLHGKGGWLGMDLRYCHTDNVRTERYPHCQMEYPYERMLPTETVCLGRGQDQAFPGLYVRDIRGGGGLVIAAASQTFNYLAFELRKAALVNTGVFAHFAVLHDTRQTGGFEVPVGGEVALDGLYIQLLQDCGPGEAYEAYIDFLAVRHAFRGAKSPLLREAFHCTWNYGVFANQTAASLLPTARFIAAHVPNIKWFLMDAGYLAGDIDTTFLDRFYPDPNQYVTEEKWPKGIRGFTDELRALGLRPGLWWSPTVRVPSRLHDEHPDWLLRNADGSLYLIGGQNGFLDYSNPEALAYLDRTLAVILEQWGMDACKMDFWSQNFEDRHVRLQDPHVTPIQARARFFETVRKHLPPDGVFMTCVATGLGNPFIGQWADTYRNTIDIGAGQWHEQKDNCFWSLPTLLIEGRKTYLLNNDSVGIMAEYPDNENEFRMVWSFMHQGMIETGGRMETWPQKWVDAMRKLTDRCDRGNRVRCLDARAFTGIPLPEVLTVTYAEDGPTAAAGIRQSLAFFNWSDEARVISVARESVVPGEASMALRAFWSDAEEVCADEFLSRRLAPRSALLWDVLA